MMRQFLPNFFFCILFSLPVLSSAQADMFSAGMENGTNLNVIYRTERMGRVFVGSRGSGIAYRQTRHVTAKRRSFYDIELQGVKHPREAKTEGSGTSKKRFVYGKLNSVYVARATLGIQDVIFQKADMRSVEVRYLLSAGPIMAMAKPYYFRVFQQGSSLPVSEKFGPDNYFSIDKVESRAPFQTGLAESSFYPGATARFALSFEYAPYTNLVRAIETGVSLDYYPRALPMMYANRAEHFMITFNVGLVFGRKWF